MVESSRIELSSRRVPRSIFRYVERLARAAASRDRVARALEDRRLLERYHHDADPVAREALVERFLPLARQLARRYQRAGEPLDDLIQVASLGLLKAIERFDPNRETAFSSFAVPDDPRRAEASLP